MMGSHQEDLIKVELKYAHLSNRDSPARKANREALREHIAEIQAEHEQKNAEMHKVDNSHIPPLRVAARYEEGRRDGT
jgi:hypothetical protein